MDPRTGGPGLRVQILVALSGLMLLAFVPLYSAVASLTRAVLGSYRVHTTQVLARAIAGALPPSSPDSSSPDTSLLRSLETQASAPGVTGVCLVVPPEPAAEARCAGSAPPSITARAAALAGQPVEEGGALVVAGEAAGRVAIVALRSADDTARAAPLLNLVGLYTGLFALALLTFTYFAITRLVVRPIDALAAAADRVARGARSLIAPRSGAREIAALGASLQTMTERLVAEEEALRAKVDELTRTTRNLTEAREQLVRSERLASVGRLASGLAHEIGNPIAALLGLEDLLLDVELPQTEQRDFLQRMKRETERIHGVLRDLLDFARPESSSSAAAGRAAVAEVIDDVVHLLRPQKTFREVELVVRPPEANVTVKMARDKLTQVVLNLCLNAGDALAAARRDARPGAPPPAPAVVRILSATEGAELVLTIEDTGPGVDADARERIFEPFFTTKDVGQGTGLGLSVCRGLVEGAGGHITLDTSYAEGARFVLRLPLGEPATG